MSAYLSYAYSYPHTMTDPSTGPTVARRTRRRSADSQREFRDELVRQAKRLYQAHGPGGVSMRGLSEAVGVSPMALYGYFESKQALVRHIWVDIFRELYDAMREAGRDAATPLEALRAQVQAHLGYWEQHVDHFRIVYLAGPPGSSQALPDLSEEPMYRELMALSGERVRACAGQRPVDDEALLAIVDLMRIKQFGYLFMTLALQRYPVRDRDALRQRVVDDIVQGVQRALA